MVEDRDREHDRMQRRLERERRARAEAEAIAERVTSDYYDATRELERLNRELEVANESIRDFVAVASHDMRSPLTSILGYTELMLKRFDALDEDRRQQALEVVDQQGRRLLRLVEDLLTVSRIEAGSVQAHIEELVVATEIEAAVAELSEEDHDVCVAAQDDLRVRADPDHLRRILVNYLTNAIKYGGPPIEAVAIEDDGWVKIGVRDHGEGIPADFVDRLFTKFARADNEQTRQSGTGLGLSIVAGLAVVNGGTAWYERNEPRGSVFGVRLPRSA